MRHRATPEQLYKLISESFLTRGVVASVGDSFAALKGAAERRVCWSGVFDKAASLFVHCLLER